MFIKSKNNDSLTQIGCHFCPELKGILTINLGIINKIGDNIWAHIVCVNWIPEIYFTNDRYFLLNLEKTKLIIIL